MKTPLLILTALCFGSLAGADSPRGPVPPRRGPNSGPVCERLVEVRQTEGAAGCWIDERVTRAPGLLRYPCDGDGPVRVQFGRDVFVGTMQRGAMEATLQTRFPFRDRCNWVSVQTLRGMVTTGVLNYQYREAPVPGQRGCLGPCAATGTARLSAR